jgi:hypothetical protein
MKGTLYEEQSTFLAVSLLPFKGFSRRSISSTQPSWPTSLVSFICELAVVKDTLLEERITFSVVPLLLFIGLHI